MKNMKHTKAITLVMALTGVLLWIHSSHVLNTRGYDVAIAPPPFDIVAIVGLFLGWAITGFSAIVLVAILAIHLIRKRKRQNAEQGV